MIDSAAPVSGPFAFFLPNVTSRDKSTQAIHSGTLINESFFVEVQDAPLKDFHLLPS